MIIKITNRRKHKRNFHRQENKDFDSWSVGYGDVAVYTEDPEKAKILRELIGRGTTYQHAGKEFAWQFILPRTKIEFVKRKILKKYDVDSKGVTASRNAKNPIRDAQKVAPDK